MPRKREPPSQVVNNDIMNLIKDLDKSSPNQNIFGQIVQLSIKKLGQELLEQEIRNHIGKNDYEQGADRNGYRNGYEPARLKTAEGQIPVLKPQVTGHQRPFISQVWPNLKGRTGAVGAHRYRDVCPWLLHQRY